MITEVAPLRALTVWQPWADAITYLEKRIENRGRKTTYRGRLLIHAGQRIDVEAARQAPADLPGVTGAVLAVAHLSDCHRCDGSCSPDWAEPGRWHWQIDGLYRLPSPVRASGAQGLWVPGPQLRAQVAAVAPSALRRALTGGEA